MATEPGSLQIGFERLLRPRRHSRASDHHKMRRRGNCSVPWAGTIKPSKSMAGSWIHPSQLTPQMGITIFPTRDFKIKSGILLVFCEFSQPPQKIPTAVLLGFLKVFPAGLGRFPQHGGASMPRFRAVFNSLFCISADNLVVRDDEFTRHARQLSDFHGRQKTDQIRRLRGLLLQS